MNKLLSALKKASPKYTTKLPSTGNSIIFRPFTVKEEKAILLAKNTGTYSDFLLTISEVIDNCFEGNNLPPSKKLPIFDVEHMFLKLREKSISELVEITFDCPHTKENIKGAQIRLDIIEIKTPTIEKNIKLANNLIVNMRYPTFEFLINSALLNADDKIELFDMVITSIESIQTEEELIGGNLLNKKMLVEFIENLTRQQYEMILNFFVHLPKIEQEVPYVTTDGVIRKLKVRGMKDFFH